MLDSDYKHIVFSRPKRHVASHSLSKVVHLNASGLILFKLSDVRIAQIAFEHSRLCRESLGVRRFVPDEFLSVVMNIIWARGEFWGQISTDLKVLHRCLLKARSAWLYCKYICRQHPLDAKTGLELCGLMSDSIQSQLAINKQGTAHNR